MNAILLTAVLAAAKLSTYPDDTLRAAYPKGCDSKAVVCESSGSKVARGLNLLHFRLDQAKKDKAAKSKDGCQAEAQAAAALAQGLPKFRSQLQSSGGWGAGKRYLTTWDGTLSEEETFAKIASMGDAAKKLFTECGGKKLVISEADEMAFKPQVNPADAPVTLDNRDQRGFDYEVGGCPSGASSRGAVVPMGSSNLGGGVSGCTLKVEGAGSARLKGGMACTLSGGVLSCR